MGAKFYRASDKGKKIRKRPTQTRSWFRGFKWVACKFLMSPLLTIFFKTTHIPPGSVDIHSRVAGPRPSVSSLTPT